jgi:hypothetical protein
MGYDSNQKMGTLLLTKIKRGAGYVIWHDIQKNQLGSLTNQRNVGAHANKKI